MLRGPGSLFDAKEGLSVNPCGETVLRCHGLSATRKLLHLPHDNEPEVVTLTILVLNHNHRAAYRLSGFIIIEASSKHEQQ